MTREQKLALIVGFALVLVVGVLISDQLSAARRSVDPAQGQGSTLTAALEPSGDDLGLALGREFEKREPAPTRPQPNDTVLVLTNGNEGVGTTPEGTTLAEAASDAIGKVGELFVEAQNGNSPAMGLENAPSINMGEPVADGTTPPPGTILTSDVPEASTETASTETPAEATPERDVRPVRTHRVQEDETLWSIAKKYYGDGSLADALAKHNASRIGKGNVIQVGASLLIPDAEVLGGISKVKPSTTTTKVASADKPAPKTSSDKTTTKKPEATKKSTASVPKTYTVKSGDTLQKISDKFYGTTKRWNDILELNDKLIDDEDGLQVGMVIKLPKA